ncbi:MAG: hemerythrin domain-containing protein [Cellvibrionaceae bacterium]
MHPIEKQLNLDHYHISRLLKCLQRNLETYEGANAWAEHLSLILESLDYIKVYPEHWHHPVEDKIFAYIAKHYPQHANVVAALHAEHKDLEALTKELNTMFEAIANDTVVSREELSRLTRKFLQRQISHIDRENEMVYPLLSNCLTSDDWTILQGQIDQVQDPLFGDNLKKEYRALHDYVMRADLELQRAVGH